MIFNDLYFKGLGHEPDPENSGAGEFRNGIYFEGWAFSKFEGGGGGGLSCRWPVSPGGNHIQFAPLVITNNSLSISLYLYS